MVQIHQFSFEVYPFRLWISITNNIGVLEERFRDSDSTELRLRDIFYKSKATTSIAVERETENIGILLIFRTKSYANVATIAHEAAHVADMMWEMIGERNRGEEANAYLVGWVASKCDFVKKFKKPKEENKDGQANNAVSEGLDN